MNDVDKYKECLRTLRDDCKNCKCYLPDDVFYKISVESRGMRI